MIKGFEFKADGRSYTCTTEERKGAVAEFWWWFAVTGDAQRYAPFQALPGDTRASVQERILAYYTNRLARLAEPTQRPSQWRKRETPVNPAPETPA